MNPFKPSSFYNKHVHNQIEKISDINTCIKGLTSLTSMVSDIDIVQYMPDLHRNLIKLFISDDLSAEIAKKVSELCLKIIDFYDVNLLCGNNQTDNDRPENIEEILDKDNENNESDAKNSKKSIEKDIHFVSHLLSFWICNKDNFNGKKVFGTEKIDIKYKNKANVNKYEEANTLKYNIYNIIDHYNFQIFHIAIQHQNKNSSYILFKFLLSQNYCVSEIYTHIIKNLDEYNLDVLSTITFFEYFCKYFSDKTNEKETNENKNNIFNDFLKFGTENKLYKKVLNVNNKICIDIKWNILTDVFKIVDEDFLRKDINYFINDGNFKHLLDFLNEGNIKIIRSKCDYDKKVEELTIEEKNDFINDHLSKNLGKTKYEKEKEIKSSISTAKTQFIAPETETFKLNIDSLKIRTPSKLEIIFPFIKNKEEYIIDYINNLQDSSSALKFNILKYIKDFSRINNECSPKKVNIILKYVEENNLWNNFDKKKTLLNLKPEEKIRRCRVINMRLSSDDLLFDESTDLNDIVSDAVHVLPFSFFEDLSRFNDENKVTIFIKYPSLINCDFIGKYIKDRSKMTKILSLIEKSKTENDENVNIDNEEIKILDFEEQNKKYIDEKNIKESESKKIYYNSRIENEKKERLFNYTYECIINNFEYRDYLHYYEKNAIPKFFHIIFYYYLYKTVSIVPLSYEITDILPFLYDYSFIIHLITSKVFKLDEFVTYMFILIKHENIYNSMVYDSDFYYKNIQFYNKIKVLPFNNETMKFLSTITIILYNIEETMKNDSAIFLLKMINEILQLNGTKYNFSIYIGFSITEKVIKNILESDFRFVLKVLDDLKIGSRVEEEEIEEIKRRYDKKKIEDMKNKKFNIGKLQYSNNSTILKNEISLDDKLHCDETINNKNYQFSEKITEEEFEFWANIYDSLLKNKDVDIKEILPHLNTKNKRAKNIIYKVLESQKLDSEIAISIKTKEISNILNTENPTITLNIEEICFISKQNLEYILNLSFNTHDYHKEILELLSTDFVWYLNSVGDELAQIYTDRNSVLIPLLEECCVYITSDFINLYNLTRFEENADKNEIFNIMTEKIRFCETVKKIENCGVKNNKKNKITEAKNKNKKKINQDELTIANNSNKNMINEIGIETEKNESNTEKVKINNKYETKTKDNLYLNDGMCNKMKIKEDMDTITIKKISKAENINYESSEKNEFNGINNEKTNDTEKNINVSAKGKTSETHINIDQITKIMQDHRSNFTWIVFLRATKNIRDINILFFLESMIKDYDYESFLSKIKDTYEEKLFGYNFPTLFNDRANIDHIIQEESKIKLNDINTSLKKTTNGYLIKSTYVFEESIFEASIEIDTKKISNCKFYTNLYKKDKITLKIENLVRKSRRYMEILGLWKINVDMKIQGIDECLVCYFVVDHNDNSFPDFKCSTCKNKFHKRCLKKWRGKTTKMICPLCKKQM